MQDRARKRFGWGLPCTLPVESGHVTFSEYQYVQIRKLIELWVSTVLLGLTIVIDYVIELSHQLLSPPIKLGGAVSFIGFFFSCVTSPSKTV